MNNLGAVARDVRFFAEQNMSPQALSANLAKLSIDYRDDAIRRGDAAPVYRTYVDGRQGVPETQVQPDGVIIYRFNLLGLAAAFSLAFCQARSPVRSGAYKKAWAIVVNGKRWTDATDGIPSDAEVMIVNPMPYARKIDTGAMRMSVPPGIIEAGRTAVRRQYPNIAAELSFVTIPSGALPPAPYVLRRSGGRKDRRAGQQLTYPALVMRVKP